MTRIDDTFARLKSQGKKAFVSYIMGGDPDAATSMAVMQGLPAAGVAARAAILAKRLRRVMGMRHRVGNGNGQFLLIIFCVILA